MNSLAVSAKRVLRSLRKRGLIQTVSMGGRLVLHTARDLIRRSFAHQDGPDFDTRFNVDTEQKVSLSALEVDEDASLHGNQYQAIYLESLDESLAPYVEDVSQYDFVDLGSGKGRAVLLAAMLPFQRVVGVEFSEELNVVARQNLTTFTGDVRCQAIDIVTLDAAAFEYNDERPLVLYIYNSFDAVIMQRVIDNLVASYERAPRDILVLYFNPIEVALWRDVAILDELASTQDYVFFRTRPETA